MGVSEDGASVTYEFTDSAETREAFPYRFKLNMTYAITGDNQLTQTFKVTNTGDVDLPFSVGGHPAFNVPRATRSSRTTRSSSPSPGPVTPPRSPRVVWRTPRTPMYL